MKYDDFVRELSRSPSHAVLSPSDLEEMAKRASTMYLTYDTPLTDAVVKVAQDRQGISEEQVKRVVEMANTSTFQRLFEKNAGDKNVNFEIADPSEVLRKLNTGASAPIIKVASADYAAAPPVRRTADLEADMALCDMFGVQPLPTKAMEKEASLRDALMLAGLGAVTGGTTGGIAGALTDKEDRWRGARRGAMFGAVTGAGSSLTGYGGNPSMMGELNHSGGGLLGSIPLGALAGHLGTKTDEQESDDEQEESDQEKGAMIDPARGQAALEILLQKEQTMKAQKKVIEMQMQPPEPIGAPNMQQLGANVRPPMQQPMMGKMAFMEVTAGEGADAPPAESLPGMTTMSPAMRDLARQLIAQKLVDDSKERIVSHGLAGVMSGGLKGGILGGAGGALVGGATAGPGLGNKAMGALRGGLRMAGYGSALGAIGGGVGGVSEAMGDNRRLADKVRGYADEKYLKKEGMAYVKSGRPDADLVEQDFRGQYSTDAIKTAARANDISYPEADPFGDLIRARSVLVKQAEDVKSALDENEFHVKEAQKELNHHVIQHVLEGGNLGEVVHLLSGMASDDQVKMAMAGIAPELESRLPEWQLTNLQAGLIEYEMVKGASARVVNPEHPIAKSFAGFVKLSGDQEVLQQAHSEIFSLLNEANQLFNEAAKTRV